jgi:hypothetical protein
MTALQNKILNYVVAPPAGVWEKITEALDESELTHEFPSKLYAAEIMPPVSAWNKIASSLEAEQQSAIPERRRIFPFLKYAAAAAIIGFLAWGGIFLLNSKPEKKDMAKQELKSTGNNLSAPVADQTGNILKEIISSPDNANLSEEARNDAALEASKATFAKLDISQKRKTKEIASEYYFDSSPVSGNIPALLQHEEIDLCNLSSRYITLITPEGNIIRMSKKLTDMVCCVSGEDENNECRDQIKKWREKIVCSPTCHSTGSFMDMLDLVEALQEN